MSEPRLTEANIRGLATPQSFDRGQDYYHSGAVYTVERRGNTLLAQVEGSSYEPYQVTVELDAGGVLEAHCSCLYDWGGFCKHIVAVLLAFIHQPQKVNERPSISDLLADLDQETLAELLLGLLEAHPHLADWVEARIAVAKQAPGKTPPAAGSEPRQRLTPLDPTPFRRYNVPCKATSPSWGPGMVKPPGLPTIWRWPV
jgi:uncharacterized Zn finger protein